ncbi:MAG: hypothetical protein ACRDIB_11680 [Ardenticatenaceae bacterium]
MEQIFSDLYAFRLLIEPQAAAWTAERARESELEALQSLPNLCILLQRSSLYTTP